MKIVYNEGEKDRIQEVYEKYIDLKLFDDQDPDKIYSISFKVTNPSLAQCILTDLLYDKLEDFDLGIDVTAIHFNQIKDKSEIKEKLHQMIDEIVQ